MSAKTKAANLRLANVIAGMHRGAVEDEINQKFSELISAVKAEGRKGTMTLTLEVLPQGGNQHNVIASCTTRVPKPKARPSLFYSTDDNNLQREDPEQSDMFPEEDKPAEGKVSQMPQTVAGPGTLPAPQQFQAS